MTNFALPRAQDREAKRAAEKMVCPRQRAPTVGGRGEEAAARAGMLGQHTQRAASAVDALDAVHDWTRAHCGPLARSLSRARARARFLTRAFFRPLFVLCGCGRRVHFQLKEQAAASSNGGANPVKEHGACDEWTMNHAACESAPPVR